MKTVSIAVDSASEKELERFAKEDGVSKSVVVRRLLKQAAWEREWTRLQKLTQSKARRFGVDTMSVDELEAFLG